MSVFAVCDAIFFIEKSIAPAIISLKEELKHMLKEIGPVGGTNGGSNGQNGTTTKHCSGKYKAARDQRAKGNDGAKVYTGDSAPRGLSEAAVARLLRGAGGAIFSTGRKHFVPSMPGMGKRLLGAGVFKQLRPVLGVNNAPKEQEPTK